MGGGFNKVLVYIGGRFSNTFFNIYIYIIFSCNYVRFGVSIFKDECIKAGLKCETKIVTAQEILGEGDDMIEGLKECSGYVDEMTFYFHEIEKV